MGFWSKLFGPKVEPLRTLKNSGVKAENVKRVLPYVAKSVSRTRMDMKLRNQALEMAQSEEPKNFALQLLFDESMLDALLSSQIANRKNQVFSVPGNLVNENGDVDEDQTIMLRKMPAHRQFLNAILDIVYYGYNLVELVPTKGEDGTMQLVVNVLPRTNVVPQMGKFYFDYTDDKHVNYREIPEFGTYILEFNSNELGLINKAIPHVLFKRFAQSCWSELCEIYGIPPRYMKTNTQDPTMMARAESMMADMGAAAWFIIDDTESFEFAKTDSTNGDVYNNLIKLCSNELSLLISGAIIGQDTVNGNRSKEESSQNMLWELVKSDMAMVEECYNYIVLPALVKHGVIKPGLRFEFEAATDIEQLWKFTSGLLQYTTIDIEWIKKTFGVEVTGERQSAASDGNQLGLPGFFD